MIGPRIHTTRAAALLAAFALTGCATASGGEDGTVSNNGNGTVVAGEALLDGQGSVLDAIRGKVPSLRIQRYQGNCPHLILRADATLMGNWQGMNPHVYVDGTRATDTCVLESLRSRNVERVEVYPSGVSGRSGYPSHAHGLILVFLRS